MIGNHERSTPQRSETSGSAAQAVRRVKEGTSSELVQSGVSRLPCAPKGPLRITYWFDPLFGLSFWWREAGAAYTAATRSDTAHQMHDMQTAQRFTEVLDRVIHRTRTVSDAFSVESCARRWWTVHKYLRVQTASVRRQRSGLMSVSTRSRTLCCSWRRWCR